MGEKDSKKVVKKKNMHKEEKEPKGIILLSYKGMVFLSIFDV